MVRSGIIGTGFVGSVHARAVHAGGGALSVVVASSPARSAEAAERLRAHRAAATADELISSSEVDVVHICTPNDMHVALAEQALRAGKHVICEKPLARDIYEAEHLATVAIPEGTIAAVPFVYRFYPSVREARERARQGDLGRLHLLHGSYLQDWLCRREDGNWRAHESTGGPSRAFGDIGIHWMDLMEFISGHRVKCLCARTLAAYPERIRAGGRDQVGTEDAAVVVFETDKGAIGSVVVSQVTPGRKNRLWLSVDGTEQSLAFDQEIPEVLWSGVAPRRG